MVTTYLYYISAYFVNKCLFSLPWSSFNYVPCSSLWSNPINIGNISEYKIEQFVLIERFYELYKCKTCSNIRLSIQYLYYIIHVITTAHTLIVIFMSTTPYITHLLVSVIKNVYLHSCVLTIIIFYYR